ncbi:biotin transporter BioY [Pullulanibacillus sp. KACC 23026]|uniref:biotin transporter BioY n=1 Tax=Pullulanibacillus sp. KACC 23026 TaxID=3028315 RepID=UPI0023AEA5A7|nr:biotin transporter BioY [Pullulanibacillus sp. KACC 23026]WEG14355.1 biotin transporter BioY [Pullulanibacillus sp. KACC 23026]
MKTIDMIYMALFAAITAVLGLFPAIPVPMISVPITLQTFGVMLGGTVLGARRGFISLLIFDLLVLAGLPILSGGQGGLAALIGPSGGYVMAWPIAALVIGLLVDRFKVNVGLALIYNIIGGILVVYAGGILYYALITGTPIWAVIVGNLAFIPGDLIKAIVTAFLAVRLRSALPQLRTNRSKAA